MSKLTRSFYLSCTVTVLFTITANTTTSWADNDSDESEIPFDEAHIFSSLTIPTATWVFMERLTVNHESVLKSNRQMNA
ncbi:MAG: hypothetical protein H6936_00960 [Burkholderiales bacterium]|nr:hypothetical protein [Nitrosomonas sp.]MCP5273425.1 hypothetical protein [Burkholderiales bacterium]